MELQELIENYFAPTKENFSFDTLLEMVEQVLDLDILPLTEEKELSSGKKFVLSLPRYSPSEAWGDPETMDRQQIDNIFKVVRGGTSIPGRIQYLNDFLSPEKAKRKTSPRVIINTMIIIESLKAAMNHFNEASAGFVFEAFMAALTGGHQEAGRIKGTLPIEDFVAFSQFGGKNIPVSLKLLGKSTGVKGSFTNLVDFLFVRGEPAIKYLVAYKTYEGGDKATGDKGSVGALEIWEFDITRENLTSFLAGGSRKTKMLLGDVSPEALRAAIASNDMQQIAALFTAAPGYTKRGMLYKEIPPPEAVESPPIAESLTFHQREKLMMEEEKLMTEGKGEDPSQWEVSFTMIQNLGAAVNLQGHGTLDFTEEKFDAIAEIYAKILEGRVMNLLEGVQNLTTNIGEYFASRQRKTAIQHGQQAVKDTEVVKDSLEEEITDEPSTEITEARRPHLNKYDPGSLLGQVVHLLEKEGLIDAAASVREVSTVVSQAWVNKHLPDLPPEADLRRAATRVYIHREAQKKNLNLESLTVHISGQGSERNLVNAINGMVESGGPQQFNLGKLGVKTIKEARQLGGGNPEPKADIELITDSNEKIGLSMKKENFAFLESWMDAKKMMLRLKQVGLEEDEAAIVVEEMKDALALLTKRQRTVIDNEKKSFINIMTDIDPTYEFPAPIGEETKDKLAQYSAFGMNGRFRNNFKIANYYAKLSDILGDKYENFLRLVVGGGEENLHPAVGVLVSDVRAGITDPAEISEHLSKILLVDDVVQHYKNDPKINIKFRLRPITKVRTTYSRTNRGKYKVGQRMYEDAEIGISWTVSVVK